MRFSKLLSACAATVLAVFVLASGAAAEPRTSTDAGARDHPDLRQTVGGTHVLVHYTTAGANAVSAADAAHLRDTAESVWRAETGWGFPAPASDNGLGGDNRLDFYVAAAPANRSFTQADLVNWPVSAAIQLDPTDVKNPSAHRSTYRGTIAHEMFHAVQARIMAGDPAPYIFEATAEWAGFRASSDYLGSPPLFVDIPEAPLDCPDVRCGVAGAGSRGYGQWPFFEYLAERFGARVIRDIFERDGALGWKQLGQLHYWDGGSHALEAIGQILAERGTTLPQTWNAYTIFNLNPHRYALRLLGRLQDWRRPAKLMVVGTETQRFPRLSFTIDHLAASYLSLITPSCDVRAPALSSVLHLQVVLPPGSVATPALRITYAGRKPVIRRLTVANGIATLDVRGWRACDTGRLALPNPSLEDGAQYSIDVSVTAAADRRAPKVLALPSSGNRGSRVALRYQVFDDSGRTSRLIRVYRGTRLLWSRRTPLVANRNDIDSVAWRAPRVLHGSVRFCVRASDAAGNLSGASCAPIDLR